MGNHLVNAHAVKSRTQRIHDKCPGFVGSPDLLMSAAADPVFYQRTIGLLIGIFFYNARIAQEPKF
jgi:hypothetical protein